MLVYYILTFNFARSEAMNGPTNFGFTSKDHFVLSAAPSLVIFCQYLSNIQPFLWSTGGQVLLEIQNTSNLLVNTVSTISLKSSLKTSQMPVEAYFYTYV